MVGPGYVARTNGPGKHKKLGSEHCYFRLNTAVVPIHVWTLSSDKENNFLFQNQLGELDNDIRIYSRPKVFIKKDD
jgi:hypothetical protein